MAFANHIEINTHTRIVCYGLWFKLLRKTTITTIFYFPAEEETACTRKNIEK